MSCVYWSEIWLVGLKFSPRWQGGEKNAKAIFTRAMVHAGLADFSNAYPFCLLREIPEAHSFQVFAVSGIQGNREL